MITDIQLPHVSGLELIELLRADDELGDVPIMAVTAYAAAGDEERIRARGRAILCVEADFGGAVRRRRSRNCCCRRGRTPSSTRPAR